MPDNVAPRSAAERGQWGSRLGFVLAAAGSAVGLGNIWKFPFITGMNGGGLFVLVYLVCIALVGLPIMIGEIMIGRAAQTSPVPAFEALGHRRAWALVGWMGVVTGFILLSYYSVIAGWACDYVWLAVQGSFANSTPDSVQALFGQVSGSIGRSIVWTVVFMALTIAIVAGGVAKGIEKAAKVMMPTLFVLLLVMLADATTQPGFGEAVEFIFAPNGDKFSAAGALEALGHSFFTLSLGMGALITYGSYLSRRDDMIVASGTISILDTAVALLACLIMFPIIFSFGMGPQAGPGLVFISMPIAFGQMAGGTLFALAFFVLLVFAALTSAISLLEVVAATVIDRFGWSRTKAVLATGSAITIFAIPSAFGDRHLFAGWPAIAEVLLAPEGARSWLGFWDHYVSNLLLPLGGLLVAIFVGWVIPKTVSREQFASGTRWGGLYPAWSFAIRYIAPLAIVLVFLNSLGLLAFLHE